MIIIRLLRPGLFLYEVVRVLALAVYTILEPADYTGFPRFVFIMPGVVFPLMALFIWIDINRYGVYIPLFISGKCVILFTLFVWCFFPNHLVQNIFYQAGAEWLLLLGDILALTGILLINKNKEKLMKTQVLEEK